MKLLPLRKSVSDALVAQPYHWPTGLLMFGSGLVMGLAPAPLNLWPLAWLAIAPLWFLRLQTLPSSNPFALKTLFYPFLWGLGYHGFALAWITHLHPLMWMGIPWLGSIAIALFAWAFITLWGAALVVIWFGVCGWTWGLGGEGRREESGVRSQNSKFKIQNWQEKEDSARMMYSLIYRLITAVALWCALEMIWSWGPLCWTSISYTQSPGNLWLLQWGKVSGQFGISAVLMLSNGLLAETWVLRWRFPGDPNIWRRGAIALVAFFIAAHGIGWGIQQGAIADNPEQKLTIGLIQGNIPTRIKLTPAGERQAIERYTQGYETLVDQGVDAVVTPEAALPILWQRVKFQNPLYRAVRNRGVPLWLGTFAVAPDQPSMSSWSPPLTQSLLSIDGNGETIGRYNKVKLVPLGEYIPFERVLGALIQRLSSMSGSLVPGEPTQVFATPLGNVVVGICYESAYGEVFRRQTAQGGQLIVTSSNNDPYPPSMLMQHHAQDVMRAVESDRWSVRVTNTGISGLVDAQGHTHWLAQPDEYVTYAATVYLRQGQTLYVRWGNWLTWVLVAIAAGLVLCNYLLQ
ncbi:MAG: apolipoprotein N-acyltransferase [Cyanobacteria bacterium J06635_15]